MKLREGMQELGMDIEVTLNRFMNNERMYMKFLKKTEQDPTYAELKESVDKQDYEMIERYAHTLKGVAGNMGFQVLMDSCTNLVADVREARYDDIEKDFLQLQNEYIRVIAVTRAIDD